MSEDEVNKSVGEMRDEYDFTGGVRGKHHRAFQQGYRTRIYKTDGTVEERDNQLPDERSNHPLSVQGIVVRRDLTTDY